MRMASQKLARLVLSALAVIITMSVPVRAESYLLMAEEKGCYWCARWHAEIGPIYPKTDEAQIAPLKRYDMDTPRPNVAFEKPLFFTPTFVLVVDGVEQARVEGYPGEDFFWGLLGMMIAEAGLEMPTASDATDAPVVKESS